ncbi:unnamed protein product, partial [Polarella glacialis]
STLLKINGRYQANGTGRDWFFLGDYEYRNGRRTPPPSKKPEKPLTRCLGAPAEVRAGNAQATGRKTSQAQRWQKTHLERGASGGAEAHSQTMSLAATAPAGTLSSSASAPVFSSSEAGSSAKLRTSKKVGRKGDGCLATGTEHWQATSWSHGQIPGWAPKRYELLKAEEEKAIGVPRGKSDYKKRQEGDHTQGVHCAKPHFHSDYMSLGQDPRFTGKRTELGLAVELADA